MRFCSQGPLQVDKIHDSLSQASRVKRLEFKDWNDTKSPLELKGVVYNEMKGAMSNPEDAFLHNINHNLFKES